MQNDRKHRDIKLVTTEAKKNKFASEPNYHSNKCISKHKFKDELGGKIMTKFVALRAKTYSFLIDEYIDEDYEKNRIVNRKTKGTKECVVKREILFSNIFFNNYRSQQRIRSDHHKVYTEEVNQIALSSNDNKRIQAFVKVTTYPYGTNVVKVCEMKCC